MLFAILITFPLIYLQYNQDPLFTTKILVMVLMILLGSVIGWVSAKKVPLTDMPQMVALFNGMGGGAAGVIGYLEILRGHGEFSLKVLAALALIIGTISFSGSIGAFLKLQGWIGDRPITFPGQQILNAILLLGTLILAFLTLRDISYLNLFTILPLILGFLITLPIGGADMPVVISLFNAMTGLAVAFDGFAIQNYTLL